VVRFVYILIEAKTVGDLAIRGIAKNAFAATVVMVVPFGVC